MCSKVRSDLIFLPAILLIASLCSGCTSTEGVFEPACIAYEGDTVTLENGRFEWSRFTDVRNIDSDGNEIDPFPAYPKRGRYEIDSTRIEFHPEDGARLEDHFLHEHNDSLYLLTSEQNAAVLAGKGLPDCPLRRSE